MPASNGDIGINLWVEEKGDVVFIFRKQTPGVKIWIDPEYRRDDMEIMI